MNEEQTEQTKHPHTRIRAETLDRLRWEVSVYHKMSMVDTLDYLINREWARIQKEKENER